MAQQRTTSLRANGSGTPAPVDVQRCDPFRLVIRVELQERLHLAARQSRAVERTSHDDTAMTRIDPRRAPYAELRITETQRRGCQCPVPQPQADVDDRGVRVEPDR